MDLRRRCFALILVLVAAAAVFPVAMQAAIELRAATIEAIALRDDTTRGAAAHGAAVTALMALASDAPLVDSTGAAVTPVGSGASAAEEEPDDELPPILKALIGDLLDDDEDGGSATTSAPPADRGGIQSTRWRLPTRLPARPVEVPIDGVTWLVEMTDSSTRLDLNRATDDQLRKYLELLGVEKQLAVRVTDELSDWRDDDDFVRPFGAERDAYMAAGVIPSNGPIRHVRELLYLRSMTPELFDLLRERVTVFGGDGINVLEASPELLESLPGMSPLFVRRVIELRNDPDLTKDDLRDALDGASEAVDAMRIGASPYIRLRVRDADGLGPAYVGWAVVGGARLGGPVLRAEVDAGGSREEDL